MDHETKARFEALDSRQMCEVLVLGTIVGAAHSALPDATKIDIERNALEVYRLETIVEFCKFLQEQVIADFPLEHPGMTSREVFDAAIYVLEASTYDLLGKAARRSQTLSELLRPSANGTHVNVPIVETRQ